MESSISESEYSNSISFIEPFKNKLKLFKNSSVQYVFVICYFGLLNYLYLKSLEKCPFPDDGQNKCIHYLKHQYPKWMREIQIGALMIFLLFRYHIAIKVITFVNTMILALYQSEFTIYNHGGINRLILFFWVCFIYSVYGSGKLVWFGFKKHLKKTLLVLAMIIVSIFVFYLAVVENSGDDWEKGIMNKKLINDGLHGTLPIPTYCELNMRGGFFDAYKLSKVCNKTSDVFDTSQLSKNVAMRPNLSLIGFPRDEKISDDLKFGRYEYKDYVMTNIFDMNDPEVSESVKDSTEFTIDISNPKSSKLNIQVRQNIEISKSQKLLRDSIIAQEKLNGSYDTRIDKNVLILYFDNISRAHFYRKLPKTIKWLEKFGSDNTNEFSVFQYFRFHSSFHNTLYSNNAMYYNQTMEITDKSTNVFYDFSKNGYVTGFFKDAGEMTSNTFEETGSGQIYQWDHKGGSITGDNNYEKQTTTGLVVLNGKDSIFRRGLYGQPMHMIQFEYLKQFWNAYPDNRKLFRTHFSNGHEMLGSGIADIDQDLADFLEDFLAQGNLEDTIVTIISDHGAHEITFRLAFLPDNSRYVENYLPVLFHIVKNDIPQGSLDALERNEPSFISSYDIYTTLKTIATNQIYKDSYILQKLDTNRDGTDKTLFIKDCWGMNDVSAISKQYSKRPIFYMSF